MLDNDIVVIGISKNANLVTVVKGDTKAPFTMATTPRVWVGAIPFLQLLPFTLDPYLISVKQGGINYYFLSLWYDSTWDWTLVFGAIGQHSTH